MQRNLERFQAAAATIEVGKISGAVGTYGNIDPFVEEYVCARLGLKPALISTQTLQRDRHAHYIGTLALIASSLEKFATEIRGGCKKSETREVEEYFSPGGKLAPRPCPPQKKPHRFGKRDRLGQGNAGGIWSPLMKISRCGMNGIFPILQRSE